MRKMTPAHFMLAKTSKRKGCFIWGACGEGSKKDQYLFINNMKDCQIHDKYYLKASLTCKSLTLDIH